MGEEEEERRRQWAEFRFCVIAPLVCGQYSAAEQRIIRRAILSKFHTAPDGSPWQVSERTLRHWIAEHREGGLKGLFDEKRKTRGRYRAIAESTISAAEKLRRELNSRSIKEILHHLSLDGVDVSRIAKSTLNLHLNRLGAKKEKPYADKGSFQRWQKRNINELWQTDCSDGIWLPDPSGLKKVKLTSLITFIDDASRLCTHGEFYWNEKLPSLLDCFKKAVVKRGICAELYSDNGSIFRSNTWKSVCAELSVGQHFAEVQRPEGKGKVERHYLTIQRGFYKEAQLSGLQSLQELNEFFWAWLDQRYHRELHATIKQSPLERWQLQSELIKRVPPEQLDDALKLRALRKTDFKTALIRLNGKQYQASRNLAGERIQARWHFDSTDEIEVWRGGDFLEIAKSFVPSEDIDYAKRPDRSKSIAPGTVLESSKNYRLRVVAKHKGNVSCLPECNDLLAAQEFARVMQSGLDRDFDPAEQSLCADFYRLNQPLRRDFVENVLSRAITEKGPCLHINIYLRRIEELRLKLRR